MQLVCLILHKDIKDIMCDLTRKHGYILIYLLFVMRFVALR